MKKTKLLGKTRLYEFVKDRVVDSDRILKVSATYGTDSFGEWLVVLGHNFVYHVDFAYDGLYLIFVVFDKDFNRVSREVIDVDMIRNFDIAV